MADPTLACCDEQINDVNGAYYVGSDTIQVRSACRHQIEWLLTIVEMHSAKMWLILAVLRHVALVKICLLG